MMSRQRDFIKWIFGTTCTVSAVLAAAWVVETRLETPNAGREPASVPTQPQTPPVEKSKQETLKQKPGALLKKFGKPSSVVEIAIEAQTQDKVSAGSTFQFEAKVEAQSDLSDLKFAWLLPKDGLKVLGGSVEGHIGSMRAGEKTTLRLSVLSETSENRQIHLHVFKLVNGEPMGKIAQYNTVNQPRIDFELQEKAAILGQMEEAGFSGLKVIQ